MGAVVGPDLDADSQLDRRQLQIEILIRLCYPDLDNLVCRWKG